MVWTHLLLGIVLFFGQGNVSQVNWNLCWHTPEDEWAPASYNERRSSGLTIASSGLLHTHVCVCVYMCVWWKHLRSTFIGYFIYIMLLTIVTIRYIRCLELIHLISRSLYLMTNMTHFSQPLAANILHSVYLSSTFLHSTYKWYNVTFVFLYLVYFI